MSSLWRIEKHIEIYLDELEEELTEAHFPHRYREIAIAARLVKDRVEKIVNDSIEGAIQDSIYPGAHRNEKLMDGLRDTERELIEKEYKKEEPEIY